MPITKHYRGAGAKVERSMRKRYGKDWKQVFYSTEKKLGLSNPGELIKHEDLDTEELAINAAVALELLVDRLEADENLDEELIEKAEEAADNLADIVECLEIGEPEGEFEE